MMRLPRSRRVSARFVLLLGVVLFALGLVAMTAALRGNRPAVPEKAPSDGSGAVTKQERPPEPDVVCGLTIVSPSSGESVGGKIRVTLRVRTRKSRLTHLNVRIGEDNPTWPGDWTEFVNGRPSNPEKERVEESGVGVKVYTWEWDTLPARNGRFVVRAEGDFELEDDGGTKSCAVEQRFSVLNLSVASSDPKSYIVWLGEQGRTRPISVNLRDDDLRGGPVMLKLSIYPTETEQGGSGDPIRVMTANVVRLDSKATSMTWTFQWDGKDGRNSYVRPGVYSFEVEASQQSDGDSASLRSGEAQNGRPRPLLSVERARTSDGQYLYEAEFAGERNNGTPGRSDDDFFEYYVPYRLSDAADVNPIEGHVRLLSPRLQQVYRWNVADLICREHRGAHDGLDADRRGIRHSVLVRVPKEFMPADGMYRFVLDFRDDHGYRYRGQVGRLALPLTVLAPRYRIEGFKTGQFYVAWCRSEAVENILKRTLDVGWADRVSREGKPVGKANSGMEGAAKRWVRDDPRKVFLVRRGTKEAAPEWFGARPGEIRAAVNGGLIGLPLMEPVGDLGAGSGWRYCIPSPRAGLWAFSMDPSGGGFASAEVEQAPVYSHWLERTVPDVYHAPKSVREAYPYGRGPLGLLVKDGANMSAPSWWPPIVPGSSLSVDLPMQRSAIAFSDDAGGGRRHFFLVSATSCTWAMMAEFLSSGGGLAGSMRAMLGRRDGYPVELTISRAFMLDGGTSTQFAYRAADSGGRVFRDIVLPGRDRRITDIVAVRAACADLGNRPMRVN
ncbi:MAG: hypothetical protein KBC96_07550 [Armatimonadetes bacterium]|nr:hypothetical protein [Armatimonadota bacterium]